MSFATKYRSQTFDEVVEQKHIIPILKANVSDQSSQINYLLYGPRGTGKTTSARLIARGVNCCNIQHGNPCNECENCRAILDGTTMDVVEIDAASHTGVDNIREEILDKALYRPSMLKKKVYIIDEVHMLSKGAFNALLKIMEEPQPYLCFILATTEIHKVPDTIVSRCQVFQFKRIKQSAIINHLQELSTKEGLTVTDEGLSLIAKVSDGCMRDAVKYLDQVSVLGTIDGTMVSSFLGIVGDAQIEQFIQLYQDLQAKKDQASLSDLFVFLDELQSGGIDLIQFAKDVMGYADQHFLEDTDLYVQLGEVMKNIYMSSKWYPQVVLAYKVEIGKSTLEKGM